MDCDAQDIPMLHSKADRHLRKWRLFCKLSGLTCVKTQFNAAILSFSKRIRTCKKQLVDISNMQSELMLLASTLSCFFTILKTVSISCNWYWSAVVHLQNGTCTPLIRSRLWRFINLFTYNHRFGCGWSILIKLMYLIDIYLDIHLWKIHKYMPCSFLKIVFLWVVFMPHPVHCYQLPGSNVE